MKATKDIEMEVMGVHNLFWEAYARRDIELRFSLCSEEVTFIGSGLHEKALNKTEYKKINIEGVKQYPDPFQIEFLWTKISMITEVVACVESEVVWSQLINNELSKELLRNTTLLKYNNSKWLVTHVHGSVPDYRLKEGDYMTNEQTIIRNRELERQVFERTQDLNRTLEELEQKNHELEIETALEKVRSSALAMKEPADMVDVCNVISDQLEMLGVKDIRNVQTAIINEQKGTYLNYQYFAAYKEGVIEETDFNKHPTSLAMVQEMQRSANSTFEGAMTGEELNTFRNWRKLNNQFPDPILDEVDTAHYYFYSIGSGGLGLSTYKPLNADALEIFKRFHNVFTLAYRRFVDIEKAIAQAREARIEAALEKIRSRALAMRNSSEVGNVSTLLFSELEKMDINPSGFSIMIFDEEQDKYELWRAKEVAHQGAYETFSIKAMYDKFDKYVPGFGDELKSAWTKGNPFFIGEFSGEKRVSFLQANREMANYSDEVFEKMKRGWPDPTCWHLVFFKYGWFGVLQNEQLSKEDLLLIHRFAEVFDFAYTRFLDLKNAEAQARESQIELALERVRARTMSMQKSEELKEVIRVVYEQFMHLKINVDHAGFVVDYTPRGDWHFWIADEQEIPSKITHPYFESVWANQFNEAKEKNADFFATNLNFEEKNKFYNELLSYVPGLPEASKEFYLNCPGLAASTVLLDNVSLYIENISGIPYSDEENNTLMRFGKVFQQTYTRFLDLQKAEAQAREAEIELSLERVRSKAMAMHSPNDLSETVNVFFKELKTLGIIPIRCGVGQIDEAARTTSLTTTTSSQQGDSFQVIGKVKQTGHPVLDGIFDHWKLQKEYHPVLEGEKIKAYYDVMNAQIGYPEYPKGVTQYGNNFFFKEGFVFAWTENLLSEEELIIFRRFTSVLSLTYRRYMDLKEAEAQAREAQIEASLERVRSRTMAMQRSEELLQVITVLARQFQLLNFNFDNVSFAIRNQAHDYNFWISATGLPRPYQIHVPYLNNPMFERVRHVQNNDLTIYTDTLSIEESRHWHQHVFENSIFKYLPEKTKQYILNSDYTRTIVFMPTIMLIIGNYTSILYTEEENNIFKRFAVVFEQSFTRFLDLQKAEAQARESQIEAALERVRSKAMAMHSSEDLAITVDTFFSELNNLNVTPHRCGMGIIDEQSKVVAIHATTVTHDNEVKKIKGNLKLAGHPVLDSIFDNWKLQKEYHPVLRGNEIIEYYKVMNPQVSFPDFAGDEIQYGYYFFFKEGGVFAWTDKELADGDLQIFRRYTSVLSLTYRRYKDLKEAEAQAREAKIEAAMEKVRARAMAMQKPGELVEVAQLLRMEMSLLGVEELETSSIYVHDSASGMTECWYAIQDIREQDKKLVTDHMTLRLDDTWVGREMMKFYTSSKKQTSILMQGENRKEWINYCADHSKVLNGYYGEVIPERTYHLVKFSNGFMGAASPGDISEESWALLNRATTVFSLAYTRFLDLQKADAQTKEAQIELALERVRARTMAMHKSEELTETAAIVFQQLNNLGIEPNRTYITIIKDETGFCEFWFTDEYGNKVSSGFKANLRKNESFIKMYAGWEEKKKSLTIDMQGEELQEYFNHLSSLNVPFKDGLTQQRRIQHLAYFSKGFIGVASPDETKPETLQLLERFAAVFNLTYTRFNDLKQAEAQNKIIQAENERKTKELEEARQLQLSMLPKELPRLPHLDIAVYMKPATEVGGDYYDFNICNDGTLTILVCDATGHGMMSGMMVSIMKSIFISNRNNIDLKEFFENTNNSLKEMHLGRLMMASLGVQITSDKVIATNAGMPSLLYFRNKSKKAGEFISNNLPLGAMRGIKYSLKEIKYEKGDTLLLMSDGFAELGNENNEQYGYNRVKEEFRSVAQKSSNEIVEHLKISAAQWIKGIEPDDDVTFVVIKVK